MTPFRSSRSVLVVLIALNACGGGAEKVVAPPAPVLTTLNVVLTNSSVNVGASVVATAAGFDQNNASISTSVVAWSVGSPTVASISSSGVLTGLSAGTTTVVATVGAKTGNASLSVISPTAASITVTPTSVTLLVGATQTITATTFDNTNNVLTGRPITWTSSAPSVASVSAGGVVTAVAVGASTITATSDSKSATVAITVSNATANLTLATRGQSALFLTDANFSRNIAMAPGAQYLIGVVNTSASYLSTESYSLQGTFAQGNVPIAIRAADHTPVHTASAPMETSPLGDVGPRPATLASEQRLRAQQHLARRADEQRLRARMGSALQAWERVRAVTRVASAIVPPAVSQTVGTVNRVYVYKGTGNCANVDSIGARTVAVGQKVIVLADTSLSTWPVSLRPDSAFFTSLAGEFDLVTMPHTTANIGDPFAFDASLANKSGKITVVFTPKANTGGGAFVTACDFFPGEPGASSTFSAAAPTMYIGVASTNFPLSFWRRSAGATATHELMHVVSYARRFSTNVLFDEDLWLEEGLAQVSSDIWQRAFGKTTWKVKANFNNTIACEYQIGGFPCNAAGTLPFNMASAHFPFFFDYLQAEMRNAAGIGLDDAGVYGAGWAFTRWAIDQYATNEPTFIKALINEPTLTGLANVSARTGQNAQTLLTSFNMAAAIFQPTPTFSADNVLLTMPSYDFNDIFNVGQSQLTCGGVRCGVFTDNGLPAVPVAPTTLSASTFSRVITGVKGTAASYFLINGEIPGIQSLQLLSSTGGALPLNSRLRVAVIRVQ